MNRFLALTAFAALLLSGVTSCKKETEEPMETIHLQLPQNLNLAYGETYKVNLPENLKNSDALALSLDFSQTPNLAISSAGRLHDKLTAAITVDAEKNQIIINTTLLYPSGATSISGLRIPDNYNITVIAKSANDAQIGKESLNFKIAPGKIAIKGLEKKDELSYSYMLYSDKGASFELDALATPTAGTNWHLPTASGNENTVKIEGSRILISNSAGDLAQKEEHVYDLTPILQKDGFQIASTVFRVVFIPQIKFFYGTYYPDLNLTLNLNLIHIAVSNGYRSASPTLYPEKYKASFTLVSVAKDGNRYDNTAGIFSVNTDTGGVLVQKSESLQSGTYKILVKAHTTTDLEFTTDLTLVMSAGE